MSADQIPLADDLLEQPSALRAQARPVVDDVTFAEAADTLQPLEGLMNYAPADCAVVQADIFAKTYSAAEAVQ